MLLDVCRTDYGRLYEDGVTAADSPTLQSPTRPYDIQIERRKKKESLVMRDTVNNLPKTEVHENE
jgi:hypothetical protein